VSSRRLAVDQANLKPFFRRLGGELRQLRMRRKLTQEDMIPFGFSARHWQQVEAGRPITLRTLIKASAAFGVLPSAVLRAAESDLRLSGAATRLGAARVPSPRSPK